MCRQTSVYIDTLLVILNPTVQIGAGRQSTANRGSFNLFEKTIILLKYKHANLEGA